MNALAIAPCPESTRRFIFRCTKKGCQHIKAADVALREEPNVYRWLGERGWESQQMGMKLVIDQAALSLARDLADCPAHGNLFIRSNRVEGFLSPGHKCDARCTGAKGHSCDCSCGGANHGKDWL